MCVTAYILPPSISLPPSVQRGHELLRTYLTRLHGIAGLVQYLDAYFAIQEWKKLQTSSESYEGKALTILEVGREKRLHDTQLMRDEHESCALTRSVSWLLSSWTNRILLESLLWKYHVHDSLLSLHLQLYLLPDSPRKLDLSFPEASAMVETLNTVKNKEHTGRITLCILLHCRNELNHSKPSFP